MKKNQNTDIPDWLKWGALLLLGIAVLRKISPLLLKLSGLGDLADDTKKELAENRIDKEVASNPDKYTNVGGDVITVDRAKDHAAKIATALGVHPEQYSWLPWNWTEDEAAVLLALAPYKFASFNTVLVPQYTATIDRDLKKDLDNFLSPSQLAKVKHLWKV